MKHLRLILAMTGLFVASFLQAQKSAFYIGANGGFNASKFKFTEDLQELYPTSNALLGLNGGVDMGLILNHWTIATGIQYQQRGSKYQTDNFNEGGSTGYFSATERLHYISVPVTLGYNQYMARRVGWKIDVGPAFNFGLSGKLDETTEYFGTDDVDIQNYSVSFGNGVNDDYKPLQVDFLISPGLFVDVNDQSRVTFNVTWAWEPAMPSTPGTRTPTPSSIPIKET